MTNIPAVPTCMFHAALKWSQTQTPPDSALSAEFDGMLLQIKEMGFDTVVCPLPAIRSNAYPELIDRLDDTTHVALTRLIAAAQRLTLSVVLDLDITRVAANGGLASQWPHAYVPQALGGIIDPRLSAQDNASAFLRFHNDYCDDDLLSEWAQRLAAWGQIGVSGISLRNLKRVPERVLSTLIARARAKHPALTFYGDVAGTTPQHLAAFKHSALDGVYTSLPWWDAASPWLAEEHDRLSRVAPLTIATACLDAPLLATNAWRAKLWTAAMTGGAFAVSGVTTLVPELRATLTQIAAWRGQASGLDNNYRILTGALPYTALFRGDGFAFADAQSSSAPGY